MKKHPQGFTLVELMIVVAVIGILAALAIPNFIRFQARSKQAEVKANLKALFTAERAYLQEHDTYSCNIHFIGFNPERGNRYHYTLNTTPRIDENCGTQETRLTAAGATLGSDGDVLADEFKHGNLAVAATNAAPATVTYAPIPPLGSSIVVVANLVGVVPNIASSNGSFGGAAWGNIDSDAQLDRWYVSSVSSTTPGDGCPALVGLDQDAPSGEPKNTYNDVNCP
ncbi:MAG TPA: prepilin-type N-terminal cleavage/methylation domain-containing protein [Myxococcaceae bacterium]|nr:prepilin-type N-terminal cleavage/methylation domain-containing protein [Myxococcaceae bacterium]